ncbi:MAG: NAD-dependent succinate-semialdehyde dehydrogenase [Halothiobacillaceae bacterium]
MSFVSRNPHDGAELARYPAMKADQIDQALREAAACQPGWAARPLHERSLYLRRLAVVLRGEREELAARATREMGKRLVESRAEIDKCALLCEYYADEAERLLADEPIETDAQRSLVRVHPLGTVLAIMPWNFPFWQVFRCAVPALLTGNAVLLKHASSVPQCALAIERLFHAAGFDEPLFRTLLIRAEQVAGIVRDPRVHAVSLTGSEQAGRQVAAEAGAALKPSLLELGGSDAFVVLEDASLDLAVEQALVSRFQNNGQSCIAAKRFVVVDSIADEFASRLADGAAGLLPSDPMDEQCRLGPMARVDLRDELHEQVRDAVARGAGLLCGGVPSANSHAGYPATVLDGVAPGMRAWDEELFGPAASIIRVPDEARALEVANATRFGLGGSVWTADVERGARFASRMICGCAFVNGMVRSDPRLPFGGVRDSGYGRELGRPGLTAFANLQTLWIGRSN